MNSLAFSLPLLRLLLLLLLLLDADAFSRSFIWSHHHCACHDKSLTSSSSSSSTSSSSSSSSSSSLHSIPSPDNEDKIITKSNTPSFFLEEGGNISEEIGHQSTTTTLRTSNKPKAEKGNDDLWWTLLEVGVEGTISVLKGLRWGLAQTLTASLPLYEKEQLLERLQPQMSAIDQSQTGKSYSTGERGSIAEEVAVSDIVDITSNGAKAAEAVALQEKLQMAVSDRVSAELDVQRYRLEREKAMDIIQKLDTEKETFKERIQSLEQSLASVKKEKANNDSQGEGAENAEKVIEAQNDLKRVDELLQKRQEQQSKLDIVENELRERTKRIRQIQTQQVGLTHLSPSSSVPTHLSPKEYRALSGEEKGHLKAKREAVKAAQAIDEDDPSRDAHHPVLGPVVADLGYKKIHLVSSGKLGTIPIWEKQRTYRNSRAKLMAADKQKSIDLGFPGIICLYEDEHGGLSILDGQHRIGMMQALREKRNQQQEQQQQQEQETNTSTDKSLLTYDEQIFDNVLVEVYVQPTNKTSFTAAEQIFMEINKAEPITLIDMPGVATAADRAIISEAISDLEKKFPRMFSPSQRNRAPNVNVDNLRNAIYGANVLTRHKLTTSKKLFDWLLVQNSSLGSQYEEDEERRGYVSTRSWIKASKNDFYLGLESSWLYR